MQPPYFIPPTSSPEDNHTMIVTKVNPLDPLYSRHFHRDEDILKELTSPDCDSQTSPHLRNRNQIFSPLRAYRLV
jgi:hypothetical protein